MTTIRDSAAKYMALLFALALAAASCWSTTTFANDPYRQVNELAQDRRPNESEKDAQARWSAAEQLLIAMETTPEHLKPYKHCYYRTLLHFLRGKVSEGLKAQKECTLILVAALAASGTDELNRRQNAFAEAARIAHERWLQSLNLQLDECRASKSFEHSTSRLLDALDRAGVRLTETGRAKLKEAVRTGNLEGLDLSSELGLVCFGGKCESPERWRAFAPKDGTLKAPDGSERPDEAPPHRPNRDPRRRTPLGPSSPGPL